MDGYPSFTDGDDVRDLHITQVWLGGNLCLQDGAQRLAEQIAQYAKGYRKGH